MNTRTSSRRSASWRTTLPRTSTRSPTCCSCWCASASTARIASNSRMRQTALPTSRSSSGTRGQRPARATCAAGCFRDALDVSQRLGDRQRSAITLGNLAQLRLQRGESAAAVEIARRAYDTAEQLRDQMALMFTGYMLGRAQLDAGHVADAVELLGVALNRAEELGFRFWAGVCHVFLARARLAGARWQDTIEQAEQAIGVGRQLDDPYLECEGLIELGHALAEVRQAGRARASWLEARRLTAQFGACCIEQYTAKLADLGA